MVVYEHSNEPWAHCTLIMITMFFEGLCDKCVNVIFLPSVHSLTCQCKKYIGTDITFVGCTNYSCETATGMCYVNLNVDDKTGLYSYTYGCLEETNDHGLSSVIRCSISPTATQVILCCNTTDYCNRDLRPDLLLAQQSAMSPTSTPLVTTDSGPTSGQGSYCNN